MLPIGGLKEKLLAALRGGIKLVLIPEENVRDLKEIPEKVKSGLEIVPVRWIDEVFKLALVSLPTPLTRTAKRKSPIGKKPRAQSSRQAGAH